jgi:Ni/Co efflux regulator RcnB
MRVELKAQVDDAVINGGGSLDAAFGEEEYGASQSPEPGMNRKAVAVAVAAAFLTTSGIAFAQNYGDHNDHRGNEHAPAASQHHAPSHAAPPHHANHGHPPARHVSSSRRPEGPGAGPNHAFHRGGRLPAEYRNRQYVVGHWQDHHLSRPPRGYHWVQTGADYVLVAIATGIIAQIVLNH